MKSPQETGDKPSDFQHKACTTLPLSELLETSSPRARRIARVLPSVTVAARLREGEPASRSGETGAGKMLWLKRPNFRSSADIFLIWGGSKDRRLHDLAGLCPSTAVQCRVVVAKLP